VTIGNIHHFFCRLKKRKNSAMIFRFSTDAPEPALAKL
jgi:hypothetical protein